LCQAVFVCVALRLQPFCLAHHISAPMISQVSPSRARRLRAAATRQKLYDKCRQDSESTATVCINKVESLIRHVEHLTLLLHSTVSANCHWFPTGYDGNPFQPSGTWSYDTPLVTKAGEDVPEHVECTGQSHADTMESSGALQRHQEAVEVPVDPHDAELPSDDINDFYRELTTTIQQPDFEHAMTSVLQAADVTAALGPFSFADDEAGEPSGSTDDVTEQHIHDCIDATMMQLRTVPMFSSAPAQKVNGFVEMFKSRHPFESNARYPQAYATSVMKKVGVCLGHICTPPASQ